MADYRRLVLSLEKHLGASVAGGCWRVQESPIAGRGVFANRDIAAGEVVLVDRPLLIGPRGGKNVALHCVRCYANKNLKACSRGCGLPVCSTECENSTAHRPECDLINLLGDGKREDVSEDTFRSLTPFRALFLDEDKRSLLRTLAAHDGKQHGFEVDLIKLRLKLSEEQELYLRTACSVLDANAFETFVETGDCQLSIRGLYPLSAMMNHRCVPNTTHLFDKENNMIIKSTVAIRKDDEILTTYSTTFWGTTSRRHHLATTKHFLCGCARCRDPTEFGSNLSSLRCMESSCPGIILPLDPLKYGSKWQCDVCAAQTPAKRVGLIQTALGSMLNAINVSDVAELKNLVQNRLELVVPPFNQIAVEMKSRLIWMLGNSDGCPWDSLSVEDLLYKRGLCDELLEILRKLGMGQCKLKGLLLCELYLCAKETSKRDVNSNTVDPVLQERHEELLKEASVILQDDVTVSREVKQLCNFQYSQ